MKVNRKSLKKTNAGAWLFFGCWTLLFFAALNGSAATPVVTNEAPQLVGPYGEMKPTFWEQYRMVVLAIIFVGSSLLGGLFWLLRLPKLAVATPPEVTARAALTKLLAQPETGKELSEVSQILRRYVVTAFGLPANELTTTEFCAQIADNAQIGPELARVVSSFLKECDVRKFTAGSPIAPINAASQALTIIGELEKQRAKLASGSNP